MQLRLTNRCGHCWGQRMTRSAFRTFQYPLMLLGLRPYRCAHCGVRRISLLFWPSPETDESQERRHRPAA